MRVQPVDNGWVTELTLIRHGETDFNRELRFQGQVDVPLNAVGHLQATRLAQRLAGLRFDSVVSSDLRRAVQTAETIGASLAMPPQLDRRLREQAFGVVDGLSVAQIQREHPAAWAQWLAFDPTMAFAGGEAMRDFSARVIDGLSNWAARHPDGRVLVVCHGGLLDVVYRHALGLGLAGPRVGDIPNAGLNRVRWRGNGQVDILNWADVAHLEGLPAQPVYDQKKLLQK